MMKTIIKLWVAGLIMFSAGCKVTTDYVFDDISTHRVTQYIDACQEVLAKAPHGWKLVYYPDTTQYGAFTFLLRFNEEGRVEMEWDGDDEVTESAYGFNASQGPLLLFTSYSVLHKLADPNPEIFQGAIGKGYEGEYEFVIKNVTDEKIDFTTREGKVEISFVLATAEDWDELSAAREMASRFAVDRDANFYQYMQIGDDVAFLAYSNQIRMAFIAYPNGDKMNLLRRPWRATSTGIQFDEPVTLGGVTFEKLVMSTDQKLSIVHETATATFFRAENPTDRCLLRFPNGVKLAKKHSGYNQVERGRRLDYIIPADRGAEYFRFYWDLVGYVGGELYLRHDQGVAMMAGLYTSAIVDDGYGDQVTFAKHRSTQNTGYVTGDLNNWFHPSYVLPVLTPYLTDGDGFTIIPFEDQFYMIRNSDNRQWAFYSKKNMVD